MGGPAGSGGSDRSDEKKVDTYSDQLKKEQARKSKFKTDKFGYKVKKNIVERYVDNHPVYQGVKNITEKMTLNRRMKFANKNNINLQGLNTKTILSKDFKSQLDAKGYTRKDPRTGANDGGDNNQKSAEQPKVKSQMSNTDVKSDMITAKGPAVTEMTADEIALKNKRKGRKSTVLTSVSGVDAYPTLSKKTLLG